MAKHHLTNEEWLELIKACDASGIPQKRWCEENAVNYHSFKNRKKKFHETGEIIPRKMRTKWIEVIPTKEETIIASNITLRYEGLEIELHNQNQLQSVLEVLKTW